MAKAWTTAGVAFFGRSILDADVKALEWACEHLKPKEHKLCIIHVLELSDGNTEPRERLDSRYDYDNLETNLKETYHYGREKIVELQSKIGEYKKNICGVTYEGPTFKEALQHAVNRLQEHDGLDTLVLASWADDDTNKGPPVDNLQSKGCSIILANVHSRNLTFFMPPAQGTSSAPILPAPRSRLQWLNTVIILLCNNVPVFSPMWSATIIPVLVVCFSVSSLLVQKLVLKA